jgi:hypothetical protein
MGLAGRTATGRGEEEIGGEPPADGDALQALLHPFPAELMAAHMIGPRIGNIRNDEAALIQRLH